LKNNVAQEKYMDYLFDTYSKNVPTLKSKFPGASDEVYMAMEHFLGFNDTNLYLQAYQNAKRNNLGDIEAHSTAQQALNQAYLKRYGKVYKNSTVLDYLTQFANTFNK